MNKQRLLPISMLAVSALCTGLTLVIPALWWLEWFSMIPLGVVLLSLASDTGVRLRRLYGLGLFYFFCFGLMTFHWFVNLYPLSFIDGMTPPAALAVVLAGWWGLSLLQALMGGLCFLLAGAVFRSGFACRFPLARPFLAAAIWTVYEWTQTLGWWGVPWGRLPIGQTGFLPGIQTASLFGSYGITFLLVAVNFCVAYAILNRDAKKAVRSAVLCAAAMLVFQYGVGTVLYATGLRGDGKTVAVAAVQGNIESGEKWTSASTSKTYAVYREETLKAAEAGATLVVWPESALPFSLEEGSNAYSFVSSLAKRANVTVLAGGFTDSETAGLEYNSMVCFLPDGTTHETVYSKRHLVPFGEYVPMKKLVEVILPPLAELEMSGLDLLPGDEAAVLELAEGRFGSLICFDSIYEELTRDSVLSGAQAILISTNDSWFTDSAALRMHNAQAQLRAVESSRYVLRSANTGLTTVLSPTGRILDELEPQTAGFLSAELSLRENLTLYMRIGNLPVYLCLAALVLCLCERCVRAVRLRTGKGA